MNNIHWRIRLDIQLGYWLNKLTFNRFNTHIAEWFNNKYPTERTTTMNDHIDLGHSEGFDGWETCPCWDCDHLRYICGIDINGNPRYQEDDPCTCEGRGVCPVCDPAEYIYAEDVLPISPTAIDPADMDEPF